MVGLLAHSPTLPLRLELGQFPGAWSGADVQMCRYLSLVRGKVQEMATCRLLAVVSVCVSQKEGGEESSLHVFFSCPVLSRASMQAHELAQLVWHRTRHAKTIAILP